MAVICPTVTAITEHDYKVQIEQLKPFAQRVHIDLMDGVFATTRSPELSKIWWPHEFEVDVHLMYQRPMEHLEQLIRLRPRMVIIHNEAEVHHMHFAALLHKEGIETGLALLHDTPADWAYQIMHSFDQILIFSGHLGEHGGLADLGLLDKVQKVRDHHPDAEIAWDGGVNERNAQQLIEAGVDVLNVGGFIQNSADPQAAYQSLQTLAK